MKQTHSQAPANTAPLISRFRIFLLLFLGWSASSWGATYPLPANGSNIVGQIQVVTIDAHNTLLDIARHYDLGYNEITAANPKVSIWLPGEGTKIVVPTEFILPPRPWTGIIINIAQRRLYYFPQTKAHNRATVVTFPIGISRHNWSTPLGKTRIIAKFKDPSWIVPKDIWEEHHSQGNANFPKYFPPGPDNPMGMLALETGFPEIFIHGTNHPWGVGMRVSHGCLHLYPENAAYLFPNVPVGTPVRIINQPFLVGERGHTLYLSVSRPVDEPDIQKNLSNRATEAVILYMVQYEGPLPKVDWNRIKQIAETQNLIPTPISAGALTIEQIIASIAPEEYKYAPYDIDANNAATPMITPP
ncbi:MAG: L,D-transpeptidase family protein [Betaproteobacteria bacterium]|nr:L,D-transpeptidase family protein [Betaproteobacteria bacterium]